MKKQKPLSDSMKTNPLVSVLIPTFNSAKYLGAALDSALAQTYKNIEIIVHDDASTDETMELLNKYSDPRLKIIHTNKNHGMLGGWNYIVGKASGQYIKFLASDDLLEPTCVAELVLSATSHPDAAIITCQRKFIDEKGRVVKKVGFSDESVAIDGLEHAHWILTSLRENKIGEPTAVLYPRRLAGLPSRSEAKAGGYDPQFSQFADFEYWIRLLQFGSLVYVHKPLCSFRTHAGSNTSAAMRDGRFITEIYAAIDKYYSSKHYREVFNLSNKDHHFVFRQKTLDTIKNIKDLFISGNIYSGYHYLVRFLRAMANPIGKISSIHHQ